MATLTSHNSANASVKRILREAREIQADPSTEFTAGPLEDNLFDWHCTLRGPKDTEFEGGLYHVRITLPPQYPFRPPSLRVLTPSGRFEVDTPVCISFTNYHEELWQPAWGIRTAIIGLQGFFPVSGSNALGVGSLNAPPQERKRLAALSREWKCPHCNQKNIEMLPDPVETPKQEDGASLTESVETPKASLGPNVARQDKVQAPNHIAIPAFSSTLPPNTLSTTTEANATALSLQPSTPARNISIFELGPKPVALPSNDPARHGEENGARASGDKSDTPQQHQVQAFPAFRDSGVEGVPIWLDSAIWILTALLGGIVIHRVMF